MKVRTEEGESESEEGESEREREGGGENEMEVESGEEMMERSTVLFMFFLFFCSCVHVLLY